MKIVMANDTSSYNLKNVVKVHLAKKEYSFLDLGTSDIKEEMTYIEAGSRVAKSIQNGEADRGIVFCGSGAGVMMVANKFKGVHAVVVESMHTARMCRIINDSNVLCLGANIVGERHAKNMADIFLSTEFAEGFDEEKKARLRKLADSVNEIENENFK